jgi:hypothetical protein
MYFYASDFKKKLQLHLKRKKAATEPFVYPWPNETEWSIPELFALEHKYIGEGLTGNKKEVYKGFFSNKAVNFSELREKYPEISQKELRKERYNNDEDFYRIIGLEAEIKNIFEFTVKKEGDHQGKTMARISVEDPYGNNIDMVCFPDKFENLKKQMSELNKKCQFEVGAGLKIIATISWYEGDISIIFDDIINCCPPPELPADLKDKKKVSMKVSVIDRDKKEVVDAQVLLEEVEDELIEEGYSDLDEEGVEI